MEMNVRKNLGFQKLKDAYVKIVLYKHEARCLRFGSTGPFLLSH